MRPLKLIALNLVTMTVAGLVTLALIEVGLRLSYYGSVTPFIGGPHLYKPDPKLAFTPNPGIRTAQERVAYIVPVTVNALGMRGPELTPKKGRYRIALVGDGHVFGSGLSDDETLPIQLQNVLATKYGAGAIDVVNAAGPSYNTVQQLLWMRMLLKKIDADLVILAFNSENDIHYNTLGLRKFMAASPKRPVAKLDERGELEFDFSAPERYFQRHKARLADLKANRPWYVNTALYVRGRVFWRSLGDKGVSDPNMMLGLPYLPAFSAAHSPHGLSEKDYEALWDEGWAVTRALILALRDDVVAAGAEFAITVMPSKDQLQPDVIARRQALFAGLKFDLTRINRMMERFGRAHDIPVLETYKPLHDAYLAGEKNLHQSIFDSHMTAKAQGLVARALAAEMVAHNLLKSP